MLNFKKCVFFLVFMLFISISYEMEIKIKQENRTAKIFPWGVGLVRFENTVCTGSDGLQGTCLTRRKCRNIDGVGSTICANGIGVCCIVQRSCSDSTSYNNTYFVSPNFPNIYAGGTSCSIIIEKIDANICQVRIDLLTLNLAQPDDNGNCVSDGMYVVGGAGPVPIICGLNTGQHMYVDFNGDNPIQIVIRTTAGITIARSWNINIAQIGCDCPWRAPTGCLMYYRALSGTIRSFNYGSTGSPMGTRQLANENYGVCIDMAAGYCGIRYTQSTGDLYSFTVSGNTNTATGNGIVGTAAAAIVGTCPNDFVVIPHPINANGTFLDSDRFCGNAFNPVSTQSKPFVLTVVTNDNEVTDGDVGNRGFSLTYTQLPCTGTSLG